MDKFIQKFFKFGIVGLSGVVIDFGITFLLKEIFGVNAYLSNTFGFIIAASSNYYLNRVWTFKSNNPKILDEFARFFIISLIGLGINSLVLWILAGHFQLNFYSAKLVAITITTLWNFTANNFVTFRR